MTIIRSLMILLNGLLLLCLSAQDKNSVIISTDKLDYSEGEKIKISVINKLDSTIIYAKYVQCGYSFFELNDCTGNKVNYKQICLWEDYQHSFTELQPNDTLIGYLYPEAYLDYKPQEVSAGCYTILFPYFIKRGYKIPRTWNEEKRITYSNEFKLE